MASSGKRKTTMAKLNRERGLADKRAAKEARKAARKREALHGEQDAAPSQASAYVPPLTDRPLVDDPAVEAAIRAAAER